MIKHWRLWGSILFVATSCAAACDNDDNKDEEPTNTGADTEETDYETLSAPLFAIDKLMEVSIEMDSGDWDALRFDAPGLEHFQTACPAGPRPTSFEWHTAAVAVNGESLGEVEVRKKGLMGSMTSARPSLKVRFNDDQRASGIRRMTLNNGVGDLTFSRECLSYDLFRAAGVAAPRCGLARVTVNGEVLGVYTHIEEIRKPMLENHFGKDADKTDLYEITIADFSMDRIAMFEPKGLEDGETADFSALEDIAEALALDNDELFLELENHLNLEQFFTFWAMEVITAHGDGYSGNQNNSFVYRNPTTGLFEFIPWGTDGTFYQPWDFFGDFIGEDRPLPWSVYANGALARRLLEHPEGRARYEETLRQLLDAVWDEDTLAEKVNQIQETIGPYLEGNLKAANKEETAYLLQFIGDHKARILAELDDGLPEWDRPAPPLLCAEVEHTLTGVLNTTMETLNADIMETGDGEMGDLIGNEVAPLPIVRGVVGAYTDPFGYGMVHLEVFVGPIDETNAMAFFIDIPQELFQEGNQIKLDWGEAQSGVAMIDLATGDFRLLGFVMTGEMTVEKLDDTPGGEVSVSFDAPVGVIQV